MPKITKNHLGFTVVEAVLILVIVALVGLVGYKVYNTKHSTDKIANDTTAGAHQTSKSLPPTINSTTDLDTAQKSLDQNDPTADDNSDLTQLDSQLSGF